MGKSHINLNLNIKGIFFVIAFTSLLIDVLTSGFLVFKGMQSAVRVCLETMIPSLYAMMILSELFTSFGFHNRLGKILKTPAKYIFKSHGQVLAIFLFSQTAGYPVGARMLLSMNENGSLTKKQVSILSGVCFGGGPAFIASLFADKKEDAAAVFLAGLLSNFIIFIVISRFINISSSNTTYNASDSSCFHNITAMITDATVKSGRAVLKICAMIIMFGGILGLIDLPFIKDITGYKYSDILFSILEVSRVTALFPYSRETLPYIGAILSFGGICVLMQLASVTMEKVNIGYVFLMRIAAAAMTGILLYLREIFIPIPHQTETASAIFTADNLNIGSFSPLPSILLLIMTFMLLLSTEKGKR